ncbi:putative metalloprotease [Holospora obtusa F1]|uniref:Metalloprotease n=1 Tax=Holospora obtusa F1 TaxID=1399147 RepID=W6TDK0_HOLOB|nr:M23 family metallopeptidase [Holospora obtusa]ETZ06679.1 putative metalloprotease [Holospora obtusa F1]
MHYLVVKPWLEQCFKKITTLLLFSFLGLLYLYHVYRSNSFRAQELDLDAFRNHNYHPAIFSRFFTLFSSKVSKSQGDFSAFQSILSSPKQFHVAPFFLDPSLVKRFPHSLKSFSLRWSSLANFMHALRLQNFFSHHRVAVHGAFVKMLKQKVLTRAIAGREIKVTYSCVGDKKCLFSVEIPINLVTTKEVRIDSRQNIHIKTIKDSVVSFVMRTQGIVSNALLSDLRKKKLPNDAFHLVASVLDSGKIPLRQHYGRGSQFFILYRGIKNVRTEHVQFTDILFLKLKNSKRNFSLYSYSLRKNTPGFFTENGEKFNKEKNSKEKSGCPFIRPLSGGRLSSCFGRRKHPIFGYYHSHKGIDLAAPLGTPVRAAASGVVEKIGWVRGYGNFIRIRHRNAYCTAYGHLSKYAKKLHPGTSVQQGQVIGFVGATGNATGNHLHFEVIRNGSQVNPFGVRASTQPIERMGRPEYQKFRAYIRYLNSIYNKLGNSRTTMRV